MSTIMAINIGTQLKTLEFAVKSLVWKVVQIQFDGICIESYLIKYEVTNVIKRSCNFNE